MYIYIYWKVLRKIELRPLKVNNFKFWGGMYSNRHLTIRLTKRFSSVNSSFQAQRSESQNLKAYILDPKFET